MNGVIVVPCFNAEKTIDSVINNIKVDFSGTIICCDDSSTDLTKNIILKHDVILISHDKNRGYGANQKSLYDLALRNSCDYIIMIHGDAQYTPRLIKAISGMMESQLFDVTFASRILSGSNPLKNGMPLIKYIVNRMLTLVQNILLGSKLSEFHSGYRAYSSVFLKSVPYHDFDDGFIFDNQMLVWAVKNNFRIGEISCPTKYDSNSSSIGFRKGIKYAFLCILETFKRR